MLARSTLTEYESQGFSVIRNVIDPELISEARRHVEWLQERFPSLAGEHLHHPLMRDDAFWAHLVSDRRLTAIAEALLGPDLACFTAHYICKPPRTGQPVLWHQDGAYWKLRPMAAVTVWLAIDPSNCENGCLRLIPESHEMPIRPPIRRADTPNMLSSEVDPELVKQWAHDRGIVPVELEPGDVSIHHPRILHHSGPNLSDRRRCGLDIGYIATSTKILNEALYQNPFLVRGAPVPGVNRYCRLPTYDSNESIEFARREEWDARARRQNSRFGIYDPVAAGDGSPFALTLRMMERLENGTVAA